MQAKTLADMMGSMLVTLPEGERNAEFGPNTFRMMIDAMMQEDSAAVEKCAGTSIIVHAMESPETLKKLAELPDPQWDECWVDLGIVESVWDMHQQLSSDAGEMYPYAHRLMETLSTNAYETSTSPDKADYELSAPELVAKYLNKCHENIEWTETLDDGSVVTNADLILARMMEDHFDGFDRFANNGGAFQDLVASSWFNQAIRLVKDESLHASYFDMNNRARGIDFEEESVEYATLDVPDFDMFHSQDCEYEW